MSTSSKVFWDVGALWDIAARMRSELVARTEEACQEGLRAALARYRLDRSEAWRLSQIEAAESALCDMVVQLAREYMARYETAFIAESVVMREHAADKGIEAEAE